MEKRINQKTRTYLQQFKNDIQGALTELNNNGLRQDDVNSLLQFIYDYQPLEFTKTDFQKRKRVKNVVPYFERCCALRANGERCTRRKKDSDKFCGTHIKGTPHGVFSNDDDSVGVSQSKQVQVTAQEINGIIYYIDSIENVYKMEDVLSNKTNPGIIAKYVKNMDGSYSIPDFSI